MEGEAIASGNLPHGYVCTSERNVPIPRFIKDNSPRTKHDGNQAIAIVRTRTISGIFYPETLVRSTEGGLPGLPGYSWLKSPVLRVYAAEAFSGGELAVHAQVRR